jgi:large subunit ribosomal protein L23
MKHTIYDTVIRPLVTEKSTHQAMTRGVYTFEVAPDANKTQIKNAISKIYNVKVVDVRTATRKGKPRRSGRVMGSTKNWKKAVVTLAEGQHIDLF